jgi:hypothetical protein
MLSTLATRLSEQGRTLTGHYPELVCDVLTLAIDIGAAGIVVSLWYGPRLHRLADIPGGDVDKIAQAVAAAFTDLESSLLPDDRFLPLLLDAWHRASARRALPGDEPRCPILEVLAELAFLRQDPKFYRHPTRSNFATYDQTHLSYQLFRLQERRCRNWELSLGIATRDEVKDRESLWIPRNLRGEGVHYSTLSFRKGGQTP